MSKIEDQVIAAATDAVNGVKIQKFATLARVAGFKGRVGGWIYDPNGNRVCQGWQRLASRVLWMRGELLATIVRAASPVEPIAEEGLPLREAPDKVTRKFGPLTQEARGIPADPISDPATVEHTPNELAEMGALLPGSSADWAARRLTETATPEPISAAANVEPAPESLSLGQLLAGRHLPTAPDLVAALTDRLEDALTVAANVEPQPLTPESLGFTLDMPGRYVRPADQMFVVRAPDHGWLAYRRVGRERYMIAAPATKIEHVLAVVAKVAPQPKLPIGTTYRDERGI